MANNPTDTLKNFSFSIDGKDITGLSRRVTMRQSIHEPFMKCLFDFSDSQFVIPESSAGKMFSFQISNQMGQSFSPKFLIEKFGDTHVNTMGKSLQGTLRCISEEFKHAISERVIKSFEGETADSVIQKVLKDHLKSSKNFHSDQTNKLPGPFLANRQTPVDVISKASSLPQNGEPHVFFENVDGFHFKSLVKMSKQSASHNLIFNHAAYTNLGAANNPNNVLDVIFNYGSYADASTSNQAQDTLFSTETNSQKLGEKAASYSGTASRNVAGPASQKDNRQIHATYEQYKEKYRHDSAKQEQTLANLSAKTKTLLSLRPDIKPGQVVDINLAGSGSGYSDASPKNSHSGKWLIASVTHVCDFTDGSGTPYGRTILDCIGKV